MRDIREEYEAKPFTETDLLSSPIDLAKQWLDAAVKEQIPLANAMVLATVDKHGMPATRTVLLKGINNDTFEFFTNYESAKGTQMADHPNVAFTLLWKPLNRQINVRGTVQKLPTQDNNAYFASRPRGSQISAAISPQSEAVALEWLQEEWEKVDTSFAAKDIPCPPHWGGYGIMPNSIEFWQGRPHRLHDRFIYQRLADNSWQVNRLAP